MKPVKKNDKLKGYALAAAATLLFAGAAISQCSRSKQTTVAKQEAPAAESELQRGSTAHGRDWKRSFPQFKENPESQMGKNTTDLLYGLAEAFPYQGLDCKLVPKEKAGGHSGTYEDIMAPMTPKEKSRYMILNVSEDSGENEVTSHLEQSKKVSKSISDLVNQMVEDYGEAGKGDSFAQLSLRIDRMRDENNMEGILSAIGHMEQLNLEWDGKDTLPWATETLYAIYSEMGSRAKIEEWEHSPDRACILRNASALRTLHYSYEAVAELMLKNPGSADNAIARLNGRMRFMILHDFAGSLLFPGDYDPASVLNLYYSLSPGNKRHFLDAIQSSNATLYEKDIEHLRNLAKVLPDHMLRESIMALIEQ